MPDILYRRELEEFGGPRFIELGLRVEELEAEGVEHAQTYRQRVPRLSVPDSFALALAQRHEWILLTGDGDLRQLATAERVDCHGVLWLLDRMFEEGVAERLLHDGLTAIFSHPRCRLPMREVRTRIQRFRG